MLISNVHLAQFRVGLGRCQISDDNVVISADIAKALGVKVGDTVRVVALSPSERA
jgi:arginine/ornithine N-succinyltransferase beta subunit